MLKATAKTNTALTKQPIAAALSPHKKLIRPGETICIDAIGSLVSGKYKVELEYSQGTWYIFPAHWDFGIPEAAMKMIKEFESFVAWPYKDSEGVPTIGYGTTRYPDGKYVSMSDKTVTIAQAEFFLSDYILHMLPILGNIPGWYEMKEGQRSALISFAYNVGERFYGGSGYESITRALRDKNWAIVPEMLLKYRNPGSEAEIGLLRRRKTEGELWIA